MYVLLPEYIKYIIYHNIVDAENMNSVCVQCTLCICSTNMTPSQTSHTGKVTLEKKKTLKPELTKTAGSTYRMALNVNFYIVFCD